ncbi:MAG TPA: hypothetical protein VN238_11460, partial [Solirubrobacteraceae bacterium]|nr:hypothetical protein [Solirubrobacteraceae bacterium]
MALRLLDTDLPAPAASPAAAPSLDDREVVARARRAVSGRDWEELRSCVLAAAEIDDVHRRYVARRTLIEVAVEAADHETTPAGAATAMLAAAQVALDVLAAAPAEPTLLGMAGF